MREKHTRPEVLDGAPLRYAPRNELGVIFLFARLAKRWRLRVDAIQPGYPDCIAYQKIHGSERRIRIEFEHKSKNFKIQRHDPRKCDWIVCWEHNWPGAPRNLEIKELRREFGLGFNVWIMPTKDPNKETLDEIDSSDQWSLPSQCHKGDLILFYFTKPDQLIKHIFKADDRAKLMKARWKNGEDYMGPIHRVCKLKAPIYFEDLKNHRVLQTAHFVRNQMRGRPNATEYWPYLYDLIVQRNPEAGKQLRNFAPESL